MPIIRTLKGNDMLKVTDHTSVLADAATGKRVRFEPIRVPGKDWSVAKVVGSKRTGRIIERAEGFERAEGYTLAQAQVAAENLARDTFRALVAAAEAAAAAERQTVAE
ncbi:MAG: hypothetical protein ACRD5R_05140 [Candidatus Acidiferrales bacterium]